MHLPMNTASRGLSVHSKRPLLSGCVSTGNKLSFTIASPVPRCVRRKTFVIQHYDANANLLEKRVHVRARDRHKQGAAVEKTFSDVMKSSRVFKSVVVDDLNPDQGLIVATLSRRGSRKRAYRLLAHAM